tara:strand:+ start:337 stop:573 length:237 start_codon:yes stop_codon:yes gene_type:complete
LENQKTLPTFVGIMNGEAERKFITTHPALNRRELGRQISWHRSSFEQWIKGNPKRPIPISKLLDLREVLKDYGYEVME